MTSYIEGVDNSKILVAREGEAGFIQVVGRGSFQNAGLVKSFYQELLPTGVTRWIVDLNECIYLDSTFLGTLTGLGLKLKDRPNGKLHIVNVNARNTELLHNLGLDRLFNIEVKSADFKPARLQEVKPVAQDKTETGLNMLDAHTNLMNWDPRNVPKFKDVVQYLKEDLGVAVGE